MATALQVSHIDRDLEHQSRRKELWTPSGQIDHRVLQATNSKISMLIFSPHKCPSFIPSAPAKMSAMHKIQPIADHAVHPEHFDPAQ